MGDDHPIYAGDMSVSYLKRPCAAPEGELGSCSDAAIRIGSDPQSSWTSPHQGAYGWVCSAHARLLIEQHQPERIAALHVQLGREGREFWTTYGEEAGEVPHVSRRRLALESLNSDV
jgi:hypothetical protein